MPATSCAAEATVRPPQRRDSFVLILQGTQMHRLFIAALLVGAVTSASAQQRPPLSTLGAGWPERSLGMLREVALMHRTISIAGLRRLRDEQWIREARRRPDGLIFAQANFVAAQYRLDPSAVEMVALGMSMEALAQGLTEFGTYGRVVCGMVHGMGSLAEVDELMAASR